MILISTMGGSWRQPAKNIQVSHLRQKSNSDFRWIGRTPSQRRIYLETFLGIIARYSDEGNLNDILEISPSLEFIFQLHEGRYGIQRKGRYFHRLDFIRFNKSTMTDHYKFYTDLCSCFKSKLIKKGDPLKSKNSMMAEYEKISPTFECLLISIALERIYPRLLSEFDRIFGHWMSKDTTLLDLHIEILSFVPRALFVFGRFSKFAWILVLKSNFPLLWASSV